MVPQARIWQMLKSHEYSFCKIHAGLFVTNFLSLVWAGLGKLTEFDDCYVFVGSVLALTRVVG